MTERERERERECTRETEKERAESLPEEKEEEEGQSGSGNDRPSALEANIDECPALLALRNQRSEERGIALFPFSPPSLASSPTPSSPSFSSSSFFFFILLLTSFPLSVFGKRNESTTISPPFRRESRGETREEDEQWAILLFEILLSRRRIDFSTFFTLLFPWILMKRQ